MGGAPSLSLEFVVVAHPKYMHSLNVQIEYHEDCG
jgi:hypothetical protein